MKAPTLRKASARDWAAIRELLLECKLPLDGAQMHLNSFIVARNEIGLIACGGLEVYGSAALLRSVAVAEGHRARRLGEQIVWQLVSAARADGVGTLILLTEAAQGYFPRFGFHVVARTELPAAVMASAEFKGACPASAVAMALRLSGEIAK